MGGASVWGGMEAVSHFARSAAEPACRPPALGWWWWWWWVPITAWGWGALLPCWAQLWGGGLHCSTGEQTQHRGGFLPIETPAGKQLLLILACRAALHPLLSAVWGWAEWHRALLTFCWILLVCFPDV